MTAPIDLESLRLVIAVLDYEARTIPADSRDYGPQREQDVEQDIAGARHIVELALAELTARRARDVEVEALLNRTSDLCLEVVKRGEHAAHNSANLRNDIDKHLQGARLAALLPFTGDKT